ncbi:PF20097 family protein [Acidimicrobiales bacterium]|nr:hypothetical protein [Acidimicrobiaceae bacterium]MDB4102574.1 PF20097 family protein [Acidimicrobiales bacterium]MDG1087256.1 PF20097 family protein [Acidimicrobiales bacterium]
MNCSKCGSPMEHGRVEVHNSPGTILFKTWSLQDLYWYDKKRSRSSRRRIIDANSGRTAYGCKPCGLVTVDTTAELEPRGRKRRGD